MTIEPTEIRAGDSVAWTVSNSTYKASDGWALGFALVGAAGVISAKVGDADGDDFDCALTAAETGGLAKGDYRLVQRVSKGAEAYTIFNGRVAVLTNLMAAEDVVDDRGHAERTLAAIEATIEGRASTDQESLTIDGQSIGRTPIADLLVLRGLYRREVRSLKQSEKLAAGLGNKNKIRVRFR